MLISAHPRTSSSRATPASRKSSSRPGVARSTCTCHQRSSAVISGHQRSSEVIKGPQRSSAVIRGHPRSSEVSSGSHHPLGQPRDLHLPWRPPVHAGRLDAQRQTCGNSRRHQSPSVAIRRHQSPSDAISRHQTSSVVISRHQSSSVVISRHQSPSVAISRAPKRRHSASIWSASSRVGAMMSVVSTGNTRALASRTIEANAGSR